MSEAGQTPSSQPSSGSEVPSDTERQEKISAVQKELQELKTAIEAPSSDTRVPNINKEAGELAEAMKPLLALSENERTDKEKLIIEEILGDAVEANVGTVLRGLKEDFDSAQEDLLELAKEMNVQDVSGELAAMEGNPEKTSPSFVVSFLASVDGMLGKFAESESLGERGRGFAKMFQKGMSQFVLSLLEKFSSISIMKQKFSLLSQADIKALADKRFEEDKQALDADPEISDKYNESIHKDKWYKAYNAWIVTQKAERPTLANIVANGNAPATTVASAPENVAPSASDIFAGETTERVIGDIEIAINDKVRIKKDTVINKLDNGSDIKFSVLNQSGDAPVVLEKITRNPNQTDLNVYQINAGGNVFSIANLLKAVDTAKTESVNSVNIVGTNLKLEKIIS